VLLLLRNGPRIVVGGLPSSSQFGSLDVLAPRLRGFSLQRNAVMEIRIRRVRRTWLERFSLWERAYEARLRDQEKIVERAKTLEGAHALLIKRMTATDAK